MKTLTAINSIIDTIKGEITDIPVIAFEKGKKVTGDYIVVNCLPIVFVSAVGSTKANVNIHFKDAISGEPKTTEMYEVAEKIGDLFKEPVLINGNWYSLDNIGGIYRDTDSTHFVNIQIEVNYSNI